MFNLNKYFTIKNLGITLLGAISFTMITIIIQLLRLCYLKLKLKHYLKDINKVNYLSFKRRNLTGYKSFTISLNKVLISQLTAHCQRNRITKSSYLETLLTESLQKGDKHNG